jgi:predicted dehydrogenase
LPKSPLREIFLQKALSDKKGKVTVEDAALMMVEFDNGAVGSFEASRFSPGRKNKLSFEIYGSNGSITFDLERMNELQCYSLSDADGSRGFKTILATDGSHPYMDHWWPPGHIIGYEHSFVHAVVDFVKAIDENKSIKPDFTDGLSIINVLEAGLRAAETGKKVDLK